MRALPVDAHAGRRACGRERVDAHPSQNLIIAPIVSIRPVVQFFVDPGEQADGAVVQRVAQRLRFGGLDAAVAGSVGLEPGAAGEAGAFHGGEVGGFGGCAGSRGFAGADHVDVRGFAGGGVEEADGAGYPGAPVAALGDCDFGNGLIIVLRMERRWVGFGGRLEGGGEGRGRKDVGKLLGRCFLALFLLFSLTILRITESQHQVVTNLRVLRQRKSFLADALREAEIRQGRGDDVEGWFGAVFGVGE